MITRSTFALALAASVFARSARAQSEPPQAQPEPAQSEPVQSQPEPASPVGEEGVDLRKQGAEQHRLRAIRFYDARNFSAAREEFLLAYRLVPSHRLLYNLAVVSMALGDSASAYDYFERCLRDGGDAVPAARRAEIETQLRDLSPHVATLMIRVDVPGAELRVDGREVGQAPMTRPLRVNAGAHEVVVRGLGRSSRKQLVVGGGQDAVLGFELASQKPSAPRHPRVSDEKSQWLWVGWTATGVFTAGAVFSGLKALSAQDQYEAEFGRIDASRDELDRLDRRAGNWALATDILGGAALVSGAVSLYLTLSGAGSRRTEAAPASAGFDLRVTPGSARASWAF